MIKSRVIRRVACDRCGWRSVPSANSAERILAQCVARGWVCGFDSEGRPLHICPGCRPVHGGEVVTGSTQATAAPYPTGDLPDQTAARAPRPGAPERTRP